MPRRVLPFLALAAALAAAPAAAADAPVTSRADALRTGWYRDQPQLSPGLVTGGTFGRLFDAPVLGQVYAQPLVANGTLLIATETNDVYGLDPVTGAQQWHANLGEPFNADDAQCGDLWPSIGVTATPVIDGGTAYMTSKTYVGSGAGRRAAWYMHALDLATHTERPGFPVEIAGTADNAPGQTFNARTHLQRPALLLMDGVVYAAFGGHCDVLPYQGWVAGVSTGGVLKTLWTAQAAPGANGAGIWQAGGGLMSDGPGRVFLATGNFNSPPFGPGTSPPGALGQSVVRLDVQGNGTLRTSDFFSPSDAEDLDNWDADFGSGGPVGLPSSGELAGSPFGTAAFPRLLVAVGKVGYVYLLDRDALGGRGHGDAVVARVGPDGGVWSSPAVWPGDGGWVYIPTASPGNAAGATSGGLHFYRAGVDGQGRPTLSLTAATSEAFGFGSSAPVVTSDGMRPGSALVWLTWSPRPGSDGGQLRAYAPAPAAGSDPAPVWSAPIGMATKFAPPGVAGGRVYVATADGHVYGFGSPVDPALTGPDVACGTATVGQSASCTATFSARAHVEVTGVSSSSAAFAAGAPAPALPAVLDAGDTLTVPVTFTPAADGPAGAALRVQTPLGQFALGLSGAGRAAGAVLAAGTPVLSFGGVAYGRSVTSQVLFRNAGSERLTIGGLAGPAAPFSVADAPADGHVLEPGEGLPIAVTFAPAAVGDYSATIVVRSSGGDVQVGLTGSARTPPQLAIEGSGSFGEVAVGESAVRTVTLTNTGGAALTVTKSKRPFGGAFTAVTSLPEGTSIAAGQSVALTVRFAPAAPGVASEAWTVTADDGSGPHEIAFAGTGVTPAPAPAPAPTPFTPAPAPAPAPTPFTPAATPTPAPAPTPRPVATPKLGTLRAVAGRRRVVVRFTLSHPATVRLTLTRGTLVAKRATVAGRRGANRVTVRCAPLRPGRYVLQVAPAGGRPSSRALRVGS